MLAEQTECWNSAGPPPRAARTAARDAAGARPGSADRWPDGGCRVRRTLREPLARRRFADLRGRARQCRRCRSCSARGAGSIHGVAHVAAVTASAGLCTRSPTASSVARTTSPCSRAGTPDSRSATCPRRRLRGAENFRFYADRVEIGARRTRVTDRHTPELHRTRRPSDRSRSSRRGTRRSCCRPGRSHRRWRRAVRWCTSRRSGAR